MFWPFHSAPKKKADAVVEVVRKIDAKDMTLSRKQLRTIKIALDYTWHRLNKHDHCGVEGIISETVLEDLRMLLQ